MARHLNAWSLPSRALRAIRDPWGTCKRIVTNRGFAIAASFILAIWIALPIIGFAEISPSDGPGYDGPFIWAAPANPSGYGDVQASDLSVTVSDADFSPWNKASGLDIQPTVQVAIALSIPKSSLPALKQGDLDWAIRYRAGSVKRAKWAFASGWTVPDRRFTTLFVTPTQVGSVNDRSVEAPDRVFLMMAAELQFDERYTRNDHIGDQWTQSRVLIWGPPPGESIPVMPRAGDGNVDHIDWAQLKPAVSGQEAAKVHLTVCPSCNPLVAYDGAIQTAPQIWDKTTSFGAASSLRWDTPWYPWAWYMPSYIWILAILAAEPVAIAVRWIRRNLSTRRSGSHSSGP
jgi:hypothetical protein